MSQFLIMLLVILMAIGGLSIGLAFGRGPIKGSCGGLSCIKEAECSGCPHRGTVRGR